MYASINGTRIYFDVEGMGSVPDGPVIRHKPVCFVLHGGPGSDHTYYKPFLTPLTECMQLVYIDNRGSGCSAEGPQSTYTLENNVADLEALREYLGLEKIVMLGQSYGGIVAQSYAVKYPERLSGLILITTSPSYRFIERARKFVNEHGNDEQKRLTDIVFKGQIASDEQHLAFGRALAPFYAYSYNPQPSDEEKQEAQNSLKRAKLCYQATNEGFLGFLHSYDIIDQLSAVNAPTLIIAGRHDWITSVVDSQEIAEKIPDHELVIFEKSSHSVISDEYDLFIATVTGFMKRKLS